MLKRLSIKNFAIIKNLDFFPENGCNIITGETGAGKSIILDALGLVLGNRAEKFQLEENTKCVIEGEFEIEKYKLQAVFNTLELDYESTTIIRREILANGKTRAFVNDTPASLQAIKTLTEKLVMIHSQHENTHLSNLAFQFNLLDAFAKNDATLISYKTLFKQFKTNETAIYNLQKQQLEMNKEKDYLDFLLNEFTALSLKENEEINLEKELQLLSNAEQIIQTAEMGSQTIEGGEQSVVPMLNSVKTKLKTLSNSSPSIAELEKRVHSVVLELKDIAAEFDGLQNSVLIDEKRLDEVNERINAIYLLKRKHGVTDFNELLTVFGSIDEKLQNIGTIDQDIIRLIEENTKLETQMNLLCKQLFESRAESAKQVKTKIQDLLHELEMPNSVLQFDLNKKEQFDEYGKTNLEIKFSANLGVEPQAIGKVASGGELSRLALAIRTIEASSNHLGTLIFDEIDTGVSGKVAANIGKMFQVIAKNHQLIAITHLPQVAASGQHHYFVSKKENNGLTETAIHQLAENERIDELANMLSGSKPTEIAKQNAKELLNLSLNL